MGREPLPLTPTQHLLFERLARGYPTSKMIARDLRMNPKRIDKHFEDACRRLAAENRREALVIWLQNRGSTPGDHPPGGALPLHGSASGGNVSAPLAKEGIGNVEVETVEAERTSDENADGFHDHTGVDLARSGGPASSPFRGIGSSGPDQPMGGEDREPSAMGAGGHDPRCYFIGNGGDHKGLHALLSGFGWGDEHELTWRGQIVFTARLVGLIAGCSLIALFAVKTLLLQLR